MAPNPENTRSSQDESAVAEATTSGASVSGSLPQPERRSRRSAGKGGFQTRHIRLHAGRRQWVLAVPRQLSPLRVIVMALLVVALAMTMSNPLRSYFQQRGELQQLSIDNAHKQEEKADLQKQLDQLNNDDYVREQARLRLGMINKGETAWRIIDPAITGTPADPASVTPSTPAEPWYTQLWSSVKQSPQTSDSSPSTPLGVPTITDPDPNASKEPTPAPSATQ